MRPLRIAIVSDIVPGEYIVGGAYLSAMRFAELLRKRGHHVIIIGARDSRQAPVTEYRGIPFYQYFSLPTPRATSSTGSTSSPSRQSAPS